MRPDMDVRVKLNKLNAAPGVAVIFRGRRRVVEEVSGPGVFLKSCGRKRDEKRAYIYFYEAEQFNVVLAPAEGKE